MANAYGGNSAYPTEDGEEGGGSSGASSSQQSQAGQTPQQIGAQTSGANPYMPAPYSSLASPTATTSGGSTYGTSDPTLGGNGGGTYTIPSVTASTTPTPAATTPSTGATTSGSSSISTPAPYTPSSTTTGSAAPAASAAPLNYYGSTDGSAAPPAATPAPYTAAAPPAATAQSSTIAPMTLAAPNPAALDPTLSAAPGLTGLGASTSATTPAPITGNPNAPAGSTGNLPIGETAQSAPTAWVPTTLDPSDPNNPNRDLLMGANSTNPSLVAAALNTDNPTAVQYAIQNLIEPGSNGAATGSNGPAILGSSTYAGSFDTPQFWNSLDPAAQAAISSAIAANPTEFGGQTAQQIFGVATPSASTNTAAPGATTSTTGASLPGATSTNTAAPPASTPGNPSTASVPANAPAAPPTPPSTDAPPPPAAPLNPGTTVAPSTTTGSGTSSGTSGTAQVQGNNLLTDYQSQLQNLDQGNLAGASGVDTNAILQSLLSGGQALQGPTAQTQAAINNLLANPSAYNSQAVQQTYNTLGEQIDDQYALQQQQLENNMAARGLTASSINGGKLSDLNIGERSAKEQLAASLATQQAQDLSQATQSAINLGLSGSGQQQTASAQNYAQQLQGLGFNQNNANTNTQLQDQILQAILGYGQQGFNNDVTTQQLNQNQQNEEDQLQEYLMSLQ